MFRGDRRSTEADFVSTEYRYENQLSIIDDPVGELIDFVPIPPWDQSQG
jgi:hypothetical protein